MTEEAEVVSDTTSNAIDAIVKNREGWHRKFSVVMRFLDEDFLLWEKSPRKLENIPLVQISVRLHKEAITKWGKLVPGDEEGSMTWKLNSGDGQVKGNSINENQVEFRLTDLKEKHFLTTLVQNTLKFENKLKESRSLEMDGNVSYRFNQLLASRDSQQLHLPEEVIKTLSETLNMGPVAFSHFLEKIAKVKQKSHLVKDMLKLIHGEKYGSTLLCWWSDGNNLQSHRQELEKAFFKKVVVEMEEDELFSRYVGETTPRFVLTTSEGKSCVLPVLRLGTWNLNMMKMSTVDSTQQLRQRLRGKMPDNMRKQYISLIWKAVVESDCDIVAMQEISGETVIKELEKGKPDGYKVDKCSLEAVSFGGKEVHAYISKGFVSLEHITPLSESRSSAAIVNLSKCIYFTICNVHFQFKDCGNPARYKELQSVMQSIIHVHRFRKYSVVVFLGDFNSNPADWLEDRFVDKHDSNVPVWYTTSKDKVECITKSNGKDKIFLYSINDAAVCVPEYCPTSISGKTLDNIVFFHLEKVHAQGNLKLSNPVDPQRAKYSPMKYMRDSEWWGTQGNWLSDHFLVYSDVHLEWS